MSQGPGGRESWGTRVGVILAVTGSAVGLGNFLRFPGKAAQYGGGAFMIPYFVAFLLLGLPIAWCEWTMGRYGGSRGFNSTPGIFRLIWRHKMSPYLGALSLLIPVAIYMYYVFIEAWCLGYAWYYLSGWMAQVAAAGGSKTFILDFVGIGADGAVFADWRNTALPYLAICFIVNFVLIYRGLNKGIEWFCRWAMPALVLCAVVVLVRVLTLGTPDPAQPARNVANGLGFMWNPGGNGVGFWASLADSQVWLEAAGQIFFSLSVGFGIVITYASYLKRDDDIALSSLTACAGNGFCEVALGGLITIPAAFIFLGATTVQETSGSVFKLGFMTLPAVFEHMPAGQFFGALFFFLLFLAAVTSSLSMLQPAIALLEEGLGLNRRAAVTFLGFVTAVGTGFIVYFSKDLLALDTIDFWVGSFCIYILATIQVVLFGWVLGVEKGMKELSRGAEIRVPRVVGFVIKYVSPVYLLGIFALWVYQNAGQKLASILDPEQPVVAMSIVLMLMVLTLFVLLIAQSVKRWRQAEQAAGEGKP